MNSYLLLYYQHEGDIASLLIIDMVYCKNNIEKISKHIPMPQLKYKPLCLHYKNYKNKYEGCSYLKQAGNLSKQYS